jgi:hypothetical protein
MAAASFEHPAEEQPAQARLGFLWLRGEEGLRKSSAISEMNGIWTPHIP